MPDRYRRMLLGAVVVAQKLTSPPKMNLGFVDLAQVHLRGAQMMIEMVGASHDLVMEGFQKQLYQRCVPVVLRLSTLTPS